MTRVSIDNEPAWVVYGRIGKTHGVHGALRVYPHDHPIPLHTKQNILLEHVESKRRSEFLIRTVRSHPSGFLVEFAGISAVEVARDWVGSHISIKHCDLPEIGPGEFYYFQLLQAEVVDAEGAVRGCIKDLQNNAGQILATVQTPQGDCLIPLADEFLVSFDREAKRCVLDVPLELWGDAEPLVVAE